MNRNVLIVLGGGFVVALVVAMIMSAGLSGKKEKGTEILVAAKTLAVGKELVVTDVKWQKWPMDGVSPMMIVRKDKQKIDDVAKGQLRRELGAGEPVLTSALVKDGKGNILAAALEPGMRAVAIKVKAESMVGGFIAPGDRVDVLMTYEVSQSDIEESGMAEELSKYATETILENVRVLAIDQVAKKEDDKAKVGRTVTLEVDVKGAEKLNLASTMAEGGLTLSLRGMGDTTVSPAEQKNATTDTQVSAVLNEIKKQGASGNAGAPGTVRVYNGENVQNMPVRREPKTTQAVHAGGRE